MKCAWDLYIGSNSLWCKIFRGKNMKNEKIFPTATSTLKSNTWRMMTRACWALGAGKMVKFWSDS